ncbi:MAG: ABC transporter permease [candidate division NC10 bacterium]|nr:ABC transporter permease [candidate division NC10 bacterium]
MNDGGGRERLVINFWRVAITAAFLGLWELSVRWEWIDPFHVSRPVLIGLQIGEWVKTGFVFRHLFVTMEETVFGFTVGTILGVGVGFLFAFLPRMAKIFEPLMVLLNALPRVVLGPLFILWFGLGLLSKVAMAVSLVFFIVFFATYTGLKEVDKDMVNHVKILGAGRWGLTRHVLLPSALTWIFSSLRTSVGFALIGAVVGEYLGASQGMGYVIAFAEAMFNSTGVIAGLIVLMAVVALIDLTLKGLEARFSYWKPIS